MAATAACKFPCPLIPGSQQWCRVEQPGVRGSTGLHWEHQGAERELMVPYWGVGRNMGGGGGTEAEWQHPGALGGGSCCHVQAPLPSLFLGAGGDKDWWAGAQGHTGSGGGWGEWGQKWSGGTMGCWVVVSLAPCHS